MSEQFMVMGKVNKGMSKKKESAWLGRWTQLGNEVKFHDLSNGGDDSKELIRAEDNNVKERVEVLPFPMFKVSQKRAKDDVGSSSKAMAANNRMPWMYAQGDDYNVQEKTTQNLLELMRPVRFYATVDSVHRVSGEINLPEEDGHQLMKGSMKLKGKIFGRYLDLFPNVDHQRKGGVRLESLESSKDTQEGKNESSSAETDTMEMDKLQLMHLSGSIASSSSTKGKGGDSAVPRIEIPDMNEEPPLVVDTDNSVEGNQGETSNSATQSMNVDHFLSRDCKRVRLEQEPEASSSTWVKRLKRNSFDSSGHDETKSLMKIEEGNNNNNNNNNLFLEILKSGINNLQPRNHKEPDTPQIKGGEEDITLQHPWIQRWCKKKDVSTDQPEGEEDGSGFEPENQKEMEKKQYPSIAAMALMGKALSGLNPYGLRKTDSLMVWNARDLR